MLADRQEREQRELRRRAREMKRLEVGDAYISSESDESPNRSDDEDSYDDESYGQLEGASSIGKQTLSEGFNKDNVTPIRIRTEPGDIGDGIKTEIDEEGISVAINAEHLNLVNETFNPLRFIALHLKELNEERIRKNGAAK